MSWRRNSGLDNRHTTSLTSSTNFRSHSDICRATPTTSGSRPLRPMSGLMTSDVRMALISGCHLRSATSTSMKAVLRVELDVTRFSSCHLMLGDRDRSVLLERFEDDRAGTSSSFVVVVFRLSSFDLGDFRTEEFFRLRLRLLGGSAVVEIALSSVKTN